MLGCKLTYKWCGLDRMFTPVCYPKFMEPAKALRAKLPKDRRSWRFLLKLIAEHAKFHASAQLLRILPQQLWPMVEKYPGIKRDRPPSALEEERAHARNAPPVRWQAGTFAEVMTNTRLSYGYRVGFIEKFKV